MNWIAEDWKGLTDLIVGSEMAFKESVLDIIRTVDVVDGRERMLMDLAGGTATTICRRLFSEVTSH